MIATQTDAPHTFLYFQTTNDSWTYIGDSPVSRFYDDPLVSNEGAVPFFDIAHAARWKIDVVVPRYKRDYLLEKFTLGKIVTLLWADFRDEYVVSGTGEIIAYTVGAIDQNTETVPFQFVIAIQGAFGSVLKQKDMLIRARGEATEIDFRPTTLERAA